MSIKLPKVRGEYRHNFDLSNITWFKVGGCAEVFYKPEDVEDLQYFLQNLDPSVPVTVLGNCSNIIIRDGGVSGVVIKLGRNFAKVDVASKPTMSFRTGELESLDPESSKTFITQRVIPNLNGIAMNANMDSTPPTSGAALNDDHAFIQVGAGALNSSVATFAMQNSLAALEFLIGIPGTIGGGIRMNAGAYGTEFKDVLHKFRALDRAGNLHEFDASEVEFHYRHCTLPDDLIFIDASFKTSSGEMDLIKAKMLEINEKRAASQPIKEKTSGSTFANPEGHKAWELIDKAGLRGYKIGGAEFSSKHCNFMINTGEAKAKDLEDLGELAIKKVKEMSDVELKWEIKRIGKYE